jgi:hypothetical protein
MNSFKQLQNQYNSILTQYRETYQNYLESLDSSTTSTSTLTIIEKASFFGNSEISNQQISSVNDCLQSCSSNSLCSGATYNTDTQSCSLRQGNGDIIFSKNDALNAIVPSSLYYNYQLKQLNQQLLDLNGKMTSSLQNSYHDYEVNEKPEKQKQQDILNNNHTILQNDRGQISKMIEEHQFLNEADQNSQVVVIQQYSQYIVYLLIAILLIVLIINFSVFTGDQRGGTSKSSYTFISKLFQGYK